MQQFAWKTKKVHDERSGTSRSRGLLGLIPECTGEGELWEGILFVFHHSEGWWPAAESCSESEGRFLWERGRRWRLFCLFGGSEWRGPVWECVYVGEYKWAASHGTESCANYFFLGKHWRKDGDTRREMKDYVLPFCFRWFVTERGFASRQFVRKQQKMLGFYYSDGWRWCTGTHSPATRWSVFEQHSESRRYKAPDLCATCGGRQMKALPSSDSAGAAVTAVAGIILMIYTLNCGCSHSFFLWSSVVK